MKAERKPIEQATLEVYTRIAQAVTAKGHEAEVRSGGEAYDPALIVDGYDMKWRVDVRYERRHITDWRSEETDKVRISVGEYGRRQSFPQRKDGSHNYERIADTLIRVAQGIDARKKVEDRKNANDPVAEGLREELGVPEYNPAFSIRASSDPDKPVRVTMRIEKSLTADEARRLHAALKEQGITG